MRRSHLTSVDDPEFASERRVRTAPTGRDRITQAAWLAALAAALVPLTTVAQVRLTYLAVPAVLALSSRWLGNGARWTALAGSALLAGLGAAGIPPSPLLLWVFIALACAVALADRPRATRAIVVVITAVTVVLVRRVLARAGWTDEDGAMTQLATGCFAATVAGFALLWLTRPREGAVGQAHVFALVVGACAAASAGRIVIEQQPVVFPRWVARAHALTAAAPNPSPLALLELQRLQNAGFRDAALARAGVLVGRDADVPTLKDACFVGYREPQLAGSWAGRIALGEIACRAVRAFPEHGAATLAREAERLHGGEKAALEHLRGDLLMVAGRIEPALEAYARATAAGDQWAASDAVRALLDRGRVDEARAFAAKQPEADRARGRLAIWLGEPGSGDESSMSVWNELVDFTTLAPLSRRGAVLSGNGRALMMVDADSGRESLTAVSEDLAAFAVSLPLPPRREIPERLTFEMRARPAFRVDLTNTRGQRLVLACGLPGTEAAGETFVELGEACTTGGPVTVAPRQWLTGELSGMDLVGGFSAYSVRAGPEHEP
ncbi:MAG: hypothetical protein ACAI38_06645 [Myxococcota bacterium]